MSETVLAGTCKPACVVKHDVATLPKFIKVRTGEVDQNIIKYQIVRWGHCHATGWENVNGQVVEDLTS